MQIKTKIVSNLLADSKPVKQEVNGTAILPPLVFPDLTLIYPQNSNDSNVEKVISRQSDVFKKYIKIETGFQVSLKKNSIHGQTRPTPTFSVVVVVVVVRSPREY